MALPGLTIGVRDAGPGDAGLIYQPWIRTLGRSDPWSGLDPNWHAASAHALITRLLERGHALCAVDPDNADQVYGLIVFERRHGEGYLHWVYTKDAFRRAHVASRLVAAAFRGEPAYYTIRTPAIRHHEERWRLSYRSHGLVGAA